MPYITLRFMGPPFLNNCRQQLGFRIGGDQNDDISALAHAKVDWCESDEEHIFCVDLPGVRKEDLKVQVEDGTILQISGERIKEEEEVNDKWHCVERRRGLFKRRFRLPEINAVCA